MDNENSRLLVYLAGFLPSPSSLPSLFKAQALLCISIFTLTLNHRATRYLRMLLAGPAIMYYWEHAFGPNRGARRCADAAMGTLAAYGIMRVIECVVVGWEDNRAPRWVDKASGKTLPLPTSTVDRLAYTIDYLTSLRGASWFTGLHWDFAPRSFISQEPRKRSQVLLDAVSQLLVSTLAIDIFDTVNKAYSWDTALLRPVSTIPSIPLQILYSLSICVQTIGAIMRGYSCVCLISVSLGAPPDAWPPMFISTFGATSLADFWTKRYHRIFRRSFSVLTSLTLSPFPQHKSLFIQQTIRIVTTFGLSTLLHIFIMSAPPIDPLHPQPHLLDHSIVAFFMIQPIGLLFESLLLVPFSQHLPAHFRVGLVRLWTWCFLLWTGRWWCDIWVRRGMWDVSEDPVGISIVRGVLWGEWFPLK